MSKFVMKTIDRELCGVIIWQREDEFLALSHIVKIINNERAKNGLAYVNIVHFFQTQNVKDFITELDKEIGKPCYIRATKSSTGWIHPFLAIKILTHYNPKLEIQVYKWLWDYLIDNRHRTIKSNIAMRGALYTYATQKDRISFSKNIKALQQRIKEIIGVEDWNKATNEQLVMRNESQMMIAEVAITTHNSQFGAKVGLEYLKRKMQEYNEKQ